MRRTMASCAALALLVPVVAACTGDITEPTVVSPVLPAWYRLEATGVEYMMVVRRGGVTWGEWAEGFSLRLRGPDPTHPLELALVGDAVHATEGASFAVFPLADTRGLPGVRGYFAPDVGDGLTYQLDSGRVTLTTLSATRVVGALDLWASEWLVIGPEDPRAIVRLRATFIADRAAAQGSGLTTR